MGDKIDRDDLIAELQERIHSLDGERNARHIRHGLSDAIALTHAQPAVDVGDAWQAMDVAPRDGTFVLCQMESGHIKIMQFCQDGWWRQNADEGAEFDPIYWQPLPAIRRRQGE